MKKIGIPGVLRVFIALALALSLMLVPAAEVKANPGAWDISVDINTGTGGIQTGNLTKTALTTFTVQVWGVYNGETTYGADVYLYYDPTYLAVTSVVTNPTYDVGFGVDIWNTAAASGVAGKGVAGAHPADFGGITSNWMMATFTFTTNVTGTTGTNIEIGRDPFRFTKFSHSDTVGTLTGTTVAIYTQPVVNFTANYAAITAGANVTFTNTTTGGPVTTWAWDFNNDGVVDSALQNPSWNYGNVTGVYSVNLTATNAYYSGNLTRANYITVNPGAATKMVYNPAPASTVTAGDNWTEFKVKLQDTYSNTANTSSANVTVTTSGGAFSSGNTTRVTVNGVATFTGLTYNTAGTVTATALAPGTGMAPIVSGDITVNPAAATKMVYNPEPASTVTAGDNWTEFKVKLQDTYNNTANTTSANIAVTTSGGAFSSGTTTRATVNGTATFTGLTYNTAGVVTVTASTGGLASIVSGNVTVNHATPTKLGFTVQPASTVTAGDNWTEFRVAIQDTYNNTANTSSANIMVIITGDAFTSGNTTRATVNGTATFTGLTYNTAGVVTVTANSTGLTSAVSNSVTVNPAAATKMVYAPEPASTVTAGASWTEFKVKLQDTYNNTANTSSANIAVTTSGGAFSSGTTTRATVNGTATFTGLTYNTAGVVTVNATAPGLATIVSGNVTVNHATPTKLVYAPAPASTVTAGANWTEFKVAIQDTYSNTANTSSANVMVTTSGGAFSSGNTTKAAVNGVATFTGLTYNTAGIVTVTANSTGLTSAVSNNVTVNPAALHHVVVTPASASVIVTQNVSFSAAGEDLYNNNIAGLSFTWSVVAGGGTINATTAVFTAGSVPGTYTNTVNATETVTSISGFATVTVTGVNMTVTVKLQGDDRTTAHLTVPFMIKLFDPSLSLTWQNIVTKMYGESSANFTTSDWGATGAGGANITSKNTITKQDTLEVSGVLPGTYQLAITSPHNLINLRGGVVITTAGATVDMSELQEGNGDDSWKIDMTDFGLLAVAFLSSSGGARWNARADYDNNLQINIADFTILAMNFNESSPIAVP